MKTYYKRNRIPEFVKDKSFVDIGGLWGTKGEMISTAARGNAASLTMADIQPLDDELWDRLDAYVAEMGVKEYKKRTVNICSPTGPEELGQFDFVHCSGIMYHVPDLFAFVGNLLKVSREYLLLGSVVMPDRIGKDNNYIEFNSDRAILAPLLSAADKRLITDYFMEKRGKFVADGLSQGYSYFKSDGSVRFGPWWWIFSAKFMVRLIEMHNVDVIEHGPTPDAFGYMILVKKRNAG